MQMFVRIGRSGIVLMLLPTYFPPCRLLPIDGTRRDANSLWKTTAAQIQVPNAQGAYTTYRYLNDGYYEDENGAEAYKPGWCDMGGNLVSEAIPAAHGVCSRQPKIFNGPICHLNALVARPSTQISPKMNA